MLFVFIYSSIAAFQVMQILMVDEMRLRQPQLCNNLFRCLLRARSTSVVVPMVNKIGVGWTYTSASLVWIAFSPCLWALMKYGAKWRKEKKAKDKEKASLKAQEDGTDPEDSTEAPKEAEEAQVSRLEDDLGAERTQIMVEKREEEEQGKKQVALAAELSSPVYEAKAE